MRDEVFGSCDRKSGVAGGEAGDKVVFERLDRTFSAVGTMVAGRGKLDDDTFVSHVNVWVAVLSAIS